MFHVEHWIVYSRNMTSLGSAASQTWRSFERMFLVEHWRDSSRRVFHVEHLIVSTLTPWACIIIPRLGDHLSEEIGDFQHNVPRGTLLRLQSFTGKCGRHTS